MSPTGTGSTVIPTYTTTTTIADATFTFNTSGYTMAYAPAVDGDVFNGIAWKKGSTPANNTLGTITSYVTSNPSAGYSIVKYTGNGQVSTIGHGLPTRPKMIWVRAVTGAGTNWVVYFDPGEGAGSYATHSMYLNGTNAATVSNDWNNTKAGESTFTVGVSTITNNNGTVYQAYCFMDVPGVQKIGKYTGIGVQAGTYIHCGFEPQALIVKCFSTTGNWQIVNSARDPFNEVYRTQFLNVQSLEGADTNRGVHFWQNGFKLSRTHADWNASNYYYLYMAIGRHTGMRYLN
jgi:hypothetical protein